jgi:hypothetical protein
MDRYGLRGEWPLQTQNLSPAPSCEISEVKNLLIVRRQMPSQVDVFGVLHKSLPGLALRKPRNVRTSVKSTGLERKREQSTEHAQILCLRASEYGCDILCRTGLPTGRAAPTGLGPGTVCAGYAPRDGARAGTESRVAPLDSRLRGGRHVVPRKAPAEVHGPVGEGESTK